MLLPGESQGRGSLVGCHLWGHTESDTTEATEQQQQQQQQQQQHGFPGGSGGKENACSERDLGLNPGLEDSHGNPLQYSCLENPHGQRSLAGYSPWGRKESDTTE